MCESSAGGLVSASLLSVAGASRYYRGGFVIYTLDGVLAQLGDEMTSRPERGACEPFAIELARSARAKLSADWAVSETGATGPDPNPYGDPAGHAWVGVAGPDGRLETAHVLTGKEDRALNMELFARRALVLLERTLA